MELQPADKPGVFVIRCCKCTREYEIHGRESRLRLALEAEGWVNDDARMVCPRCPAPRESGIIFNHARQEARRARRAA